MQFGIRTQMRYVPYGPWSHVPPPYVWADVDTADSPTTDAKDEVAEVCALCFHKRKTTACGDLKAPFCDECLDPHTCGTLTVYVDTQDQ